VLDLGSLIKNSIYIGRVHLPVGGGLGLLISQ
jgi:hypothetical protein